jgi:hypothetical protein
MARIARLRIHVFISISSRITCPTFHDYFPSSQDHYLTWFMIISRRVRFEQTVDVSAIFIDFHNTICVSMFPCFLSYRSDQLVFCFTVDADHDPRPERQLTLLMILSIPFHSIPFDYDCESDHRTFSFSSSLYDCPVNIQRIRQN